VLHLEYEADIQSDPNAALTKLCQSLGRPAHPLPPKYQRINTKSLADVLTNHAEVVDCLTGTVHEWMLTEA